MKSKYKRRLEYTVKNKKQLKFLFFCNVVSFQFFPIKVLNHLLELIFTLLFSYNCENAINLQNIIFSRNDRVRM